MEDKEKELAEEISNKVIENIKKELPRKQYSIGKTINAVKDILIIVLLLVIVLIGYKTKKDIDKNFSINKVDGHDLTLENNGILGFTVADFEDVIIGKANKEALLIVDEQELTVKSQLTKSGLFGWGIFTKNQNIIYAGKAQYTVDLSSLSKNDIEVNEDKHTVIITVPSVVLHKIIFEPKNTIVGDSDNGLLAFGDIDLNPKQTSSFESDAVELLEEKAKEKECLDKANEYAYYVLRDLFETAIESIDPSFKVKINFK